MRQLSSITNALVGYPTCTDANIGSHALFVEAGIGVYGPETTQPHIP